MGASLSACARPGAWRRRNSGSPAGQHADGDGGQTERDETSAGSEVLESLQLPDEAQAGPPPEAAQPAAAQPAAAQPAAAHTCSDCHEQPAAAAAAGAGSAAWTGPAAAAAAAAAAAIARASHAISRAEAADRCKQQRQQRHAAGLAEIEPAADDGSDAGWAAGAAQAGTAGADAATSCSVAVPEQRWKLLQQAFDARQAREDDLWTDEGEEQLAEAAAQLCAPHEPPQPAVEASEPSFAANIPAEADQWQMQQQQQRRRQQPAAAGPLLMAWREPRSNSSLRRRATCSGHLRSAPTAWQQLPGKVSGLSWAATAALATQPLPAVAMEGQQPLQPLEPGALRSCVTRLTPRGAGSAAAPAARAAGRVGLSAEVCSAAASSALCQLALQQASNEAALQRLLQEQSQCDSIALEHSSPVLSRQAPYAGSIAAQRSVLTVPGAQLYGSPSSLYGVLQAQPSTRSLPGSLGCPGVPVPLARVSTASSTVTHEQPLVLLPGSMQVAPVLPWTPLGPSSLSTGSIAWPVAGPVAGQVAGWPMLATAAFAPAAPPGACIVPAHPGMAYPASSVASSVAGDSRPASAGVRAADVNMAVVRAKAHAAARTGWRTPLVSPRQPPQQQGRPSAAVRPPASSSKHGGGASSSISTGTPRNEALHAASARQQQWQQEEQAGGWERDVMPGVPPARQSTCVHSGAKPAGASPSKAAARRCDQSADNPFLLATPRDAARRGAQLAWAAAEGSIDDSNPFLRDSLVLDAPAGSAWAAQR